MPSLFADEKAIVNNFGFPGARVSLKIDRVNRRGAEAMRAEEEKASDGDYID